MNIRSGRKYMGYVMAYFLQNIHFFTVRTKQLEWDGDGTEYHDKSFLRLKNA